MRVTDVRVLSVFDASYDNPHLGSDHGDDLDAFFSPPPSDANADDVSPLRGDARILDLVRN